LENEHVTNCAGYRTVAHIPLHFDAPLPEAPADGDDEAAKRKRIFLEVGLFVGTTLALIFVVVAYRSAG
jgi:hypothetical protein